MVEITCYCIIVGSKFSPSCAEREYTIELEEKNEVGDIGKLGRYRNKPTPYGSGNYMISRDLLDESIQDLEKIDKLKQIIPKLKSSGVDFISVVVNVAYWNQCNYEMSSTLLRKLADLNIPISFTVYEKDEPIID